MPIANHELLVHPAANLFPLMEGKPFAELVDDIKKRGLQSPIAILPDGRLIDGRNRLRACKEAGVPPAFVEVNPDDPVAYAVSANKHRRHLTSSQLAAFAVEELPKLREKAKERKRDGGQRGRDAQQDRLPEKSREANPDTRERTDGKGTGESHAQAAKIFGTNAQYVRQAEQIKRDAPDVFGKLKAGEIEMKEAIAETAKRTGKRAEIRANAALQRAAEFVGRIEGVPGYCEKASVDAIRSDERLRRHWKEAARAAIAALRAMLKRLEDE